MTNIMEGDDKYFNIYQPNDEYWGIGIENETYFQLSTDLLLNKYKLLNQRRERYSLDYNLNFKSDLLKTYLNKIFDKDTYLIPQFLNCHTLTKCDINGEHKTLYGKDSINNPKFIGYTFHDLLMSNDFFSDNFNKAYVFDGDTIEFITNNFYKTTVNKIIDELIINKNEFLKSINYIMDEYDIKLQYPKYNYGLVSFLTNDENITPFNNGTYHINITLPTKLDSEGKISDFELFKMQHKNYINVIQWLEPLIIGLYGSPDIYSILGNEDYSLGSLRCTISRYIGIGTYDTDKMIPGKKLNDEIQNTKLYGKHNSWYNYVCQNSGYIYDKKIGYDINFNKHYNAGIEIRFLDSFPNKYLSDLINLFILLADHSLTYTNINSIDSFPSWDEMVILSLKYGYNALCPENFVQDLKEILHFDTLEDKNYTIEQLLNIIASELYSKYKDDGKCVNLMSPNMKELKLYNINLYMWIGNYKQYFDDVLPDINNHYIIDRYNKSKLNL